MSEAPKPKPLSLAGVLAWRTRATWLALVFERAAPLLLPPLLVVAGFVALAWFGLFERLDAPLRAALGLAALGAIGWFALPLRHLHLPDEGEVRRRLDASRPEAHRPLETLADSNALTGDALANALWREHRRRAERASLALDVTPADAQIRRRDPLALYALVLLGLVAGGFVAGAERLERLAFALDWSSPRGALTPPRLDAWLDPPAYTGRPPVFLTQEGVAVEGPISVTAGAILTVRASGGRAGSTPELTLEHGSGLTPAPAPDKPERIPPGVALEKRLVKGDEALLVKRGRTTLARFDLRAIPDRPPVVRLKEATAQRASPDRQTAAGLRLAFELEDDYGIVKAGAVLESDARRTLFPPPEVSLPLRLGAGDVTVPTEDHPWAGAEVRLHLFAEDDLGQKAQSETKTLHLPARAFQNPLARALVEQRRALVFAPDERDRVVLAFDALLFAPEVHTPNVGDVIALTALRAGLKRARTDERLRDVADAIYDYARYVEDGDMSEAEKRLRDAQARLNEAIERNAPPEEINRLAQEMRRAMDEYLRELAKRGENDPHAQNQPTDPNSKTITSDDLARMMKRIEEAARNGDQAEAQRLLKELGELMKNLRSARRQNADPQMREMGRQMRELEQLQREQRELKDRTYRQERDGQRESGRQKQDGNGLAEDQKSLRDRLNRLREKMPGQQGEGLEQADEGMGDAQQNLGKGKPGPATEGQQKALEGMSRAQEGLGREMERMLGQGQSGEEQDGMGDQPGPGTRGRAENSTDPLGRPQAREGRNNEDNSGVDVPDKDALQGSVSERAARVLRELRKRLGEFERPRDELDYLERLLRRQQ